MELNQLTHSLVRRANTPTYNKWVVAQDLIDVAMTEKIDVTAPQKEALANNAQAVAKEATAKIRDVADNKVQVVNPEESAVGLETALGVTTVKIRKSNCRRECVTKYS